MKRLIYLLFSLFSLLTLSVQGQKVLQLSHPESGEQAFLREGSFLVFKIKEGGEVKEGKIRRITDQTIAFDDGQVELASIKVLAGNTKGRKAVSKVVNVLGNAFIVAGSVVFHCGWDIMLHSEYYFWPVGGSVWAAGAAIAGLGYVLDAVTYPFDHVVRVRNYQGWDVNIIDLGGETVQSDDEPEKVSGPKKSKKKTIDDDVYGD